MNGNVISDLNIFGKLNGQADRKSSQSLISSDINKRDGNIEGIEIELLTSCHRLRYVHQLSSLTQNRQLTAKSDLCDILSNNEAESKRH